MPDIPVESPLGYLGVFFILAGFILFLAAVGIIRIEKVSIVPGPRTIISSITALAIGAFLIFLEVSFGSRSAQPVATQPPPTTSVPIAAQPTAPAAPQLPTETPSAALPTQLPSPTQETQFPSTPTPIIFAKYTPTPPVPVTGQTQDVTLEEKTTAALFEGELYISLQSVSSYSNEVIAIVGSPGFQPATVDRMPSGFKFNYPSTAVFEILILGFGPGIFPEAEFRVTHLGPTGLQSMLAEPVQTLVIDKTETGTFFDGDLTITLSDVSSYQDQVTAVVASPGIDSLTFEAKPVGFRFQYQGRSAYEILVASFGYGIFEQTEFVVARLK